jgi:triosephosphate isomerase (TIM)
MEISRIKLIAGNWKLNPANDESALELLRQLRTRLAPFTKTQIAVMPPFTMLHLAVEALKGTRIAVGAQNLYWEDTGAFTGEISAPMLKSTGCKYVIIGHSERRQFFGERNDFVHRKTVTALKHGLIPIVCVGETLEQREAGQEQAVVRAQVTEAMQGISDADIRPVVIAYEPVWAIGTGRTASPAQAQDMHRFIRQIFEDMLHAEIAASLLLLYGGSVKPENAKELLSQPDIDGALVGGASLKAESFAEIVASAE